MLRKTTVSFSDPRAAPAMTKATVALSVSSLAHVRLTQNFPANLFPFRSVIQACVCSIQYSG